MAPVDLQASPVQLPGYHLGRHAFRTGSAEHIHAQTESGRSVLLRLPLAEQDLVQATASYRFAAQTAQGLDGVGYVPCHEVRSHAGRPVMVLEEARGTPLETLIPERGMRMDKLIDTSVALAKALNALHVQGVAHRDVTPDAVLLMAEDGACRFLSLETAALLQQGVSTSGEDVTVNPLYAAPEMTGCMEVAVDLRADLYALGAVMFRMAIGRPPYLATGNRPIAYAHITQPIPDLGELRPELPAVFCDIIVRLLQKDPGDRYDTANGVLQDLLLCAEQFHRSGTVRSFELGQKDKLSNFEISDKPYGRATEIDTLLAACNLTRQERTRTVIAISGPSGIGKTTVVDRLRVPLAIAGVQFVTGKFDQFQRDTPYLAFTEVAANLARLQMRLGESERTEIRTQYREAVGDYGALLTELVPELRAILGPQAEVPEVAPTEAEFRFNALVGRFFRAMATRERPMVMFIDDIQWADPASLRIMEALAEMDGLDNFIMILGYRSDEVTSGHPAAQMLAHTKAHVAQFRELEIGPLSAGDVRDIMADALDREGRDIDAVAGLVHSISSGNPFFVREFLISLHDRGLIRFDPAHDDWQLDLDRISDVSVPDSVAGMLTDRIADMPAQTLELLDIGSCIGNAFDLLSLSRLTGRTLSRIASDLTPAVRGSLIIPLGSNQRLFEALDEGDTALDLSQKLGNARYRFRHDQARLAAHDRMTPERRAELHMQIGNLMLSSMNPQERERHAVEIFGHLEFGAGNVPSLQERVEIARIGLQASRASRKGLAFVTAKAQLVTASALMPEDAWQTHQDLQLDLALGLAECAYAMNDRAAMEAASRTILAHVSDPVKTAPLQILRVSFLSQQNEFDAAVDVAVSLSSALGVKLPRNPSKLHVLGVALRALVQQSGKDLSAYAKLPEATDPNIRSALNLIANSAVPAYFAMPNLLPVLGITGTQLSFKHGMAPDSSYCLAVQGLVYVGPLNMIERGCQFGELAVEVGKRYDTRHRARGEYIVNTFLTHWKRPYAQVAQDLVDGHNANRDAGEHETATYCAGVSLYSDWLSGRSTSIEQKQPQLIRYLVDVDMKHVKAAFLSWIELFRALQSSDLGDDLKGELHDYAAELPTYDGSGVLISITSIAAGILDFFAGRHERAEARFALAARFEEGILGQILVPALCFFRALNGYRLAQGKTGPRGVLRHARTCHKRLRYWRKFGEVNLGHQVALLDAEVSLLSGAKAAALSSLDRAVNYAGDTAPLYTMLAETRRAEILESQRLKTPARRAAARAVDAAERWEATAVANTLRDRFGLEEDASLQGNTVGSSDLADVLDTVGAIAAEKDRDTLLERILSNAIRVANADSGVLVQVAADGTPRAESLKLRDMPPDTTTRDLSALDPAWARSIERCLLTGKTLVSNAPTQDFLNQRKPSSKDAKSLICVPIITKGQVAGAICLTNHLARHVFDTARTRIAEALSSQAGIALENAQLYKDVQDALAKQTAQAEASRRFVPEALLQALGERAITDVQLDNVVEQDLSVVFADIRGFTAISRDLGPDRTIQMINRYLGHVQAGIAGNNGFVGNYMGDGLLALFPGRMDDALHGAIAMSRGLDGYNRDRGAFPELSIGLSINRGGVTLGMIGDQDHIQCGVLGDAVNVASRIEALTKSLGAQLLINSPCIAQLEDPGRFLLRPIGQFAVPGQTRPVSLHECLDVYPEAVYTRLSATRETFARAVDLATAGDTDTAADLFDRCDTEAGGDRVARRLADRCRS